MILQRGRLAGAGLAEQHEELAVGDVEVEPAQRGVVAELFRDVLELDMSHQSRTPRDWPLAVSKKCACAGSMRAKTWSPALATKPERVRARSICEPNFRSTMSYEPSGSMMCASAGRKPSAAWCATMTPSGLTPSASFLAGAAVQLAEQFGREDETLRRAFDGDGGLALLLGDGGVRHVHHRAADELRDEQVLRMRVDFGRAADLLQHALMHDDDAVGEAHRLDLVVRDVDGGRALLQMQTLDLGAHLFAQLGVERADRLVHQHRLRTPDQRAADGDALHVAARQRRRFAVEQIGDPAAPWRSRALPCRSRCSAYAWRAAERRCSRRRSYAGRARRTGTPSRCRGPPP